MFSLPFEIAWARAARASAGKPKLRGTFDLNNYTGYRVVSLVPKPPSGARHDI